MKKYVLALILAAFPAGAAYAQMCVPFCVSNSGSYQTNALFNVSSGTVQNTLTVGTLVTQALNISSVTAGVFTGSGTYVTNLNASQILAGTVPVGRLAGNYQGVTGVGAISSGTWQGAVLAPQYGGTGQNFVNVSTGAIPFFVATGSMGVVNSPAFYGALISPSQFSKPVWISSPALQGYNFVDIPVSALIGGSTIPASIIITTNSIPNVNGTAVIGNIGGNAANITGTLAQAQVAAGTWDSAHPASSITVTGVQAGICGGPGLLCAPVIRTDGRVSSWAQYNNVVYSTNIAPGPLPSGVTIAAAQIASGTLAGNVVATSMTATGISPNTYGGPAQTLTLKFGLDGRASTVTVSNIALPPSQLNSGTLPSGVGVPAANVQSGALGAAVIASSVALSGVTPGACGDSAHYCAATFGGDGRATAAAAYPINGSTGTAYVNVDNSWSATQTFQASVTAQGSMFAGEFFGLGDGLYGLQPTSVASGTFPTNVTASSVSIPFLLTNGSVTASNFVGNGSYLTGVVNVGVYNLFTASQAFSAAGGLGVTYGVTAGSFTATSSITASAFFGNGAALTGISSTFNGGTVAGQALFQSSVTMQASGFSVGGSSFVVAGGSATVGYALTAGAFVGPLTGNVTGTASAVLTSGVNLSTVTTAFQAVATSTAALQAQANSAAVSTTALAAQFVTNPSSETNTSTGGLLVASSVTAHAFYGDGSHLTGLSTVVQHGFLSGTNQTSGVGTFQLGYAGTAVTISSITVLVTTAGTGGSGGTIWACCYGGSCVSVTSAQGAAIGSVYTGNGSVAVPANGQMVLQMTSTSEGTTPTVNATCGY